jgi:hypothetical protein
MRPTSSRAAFILLALASALGACADVAGLDRFQKRSVAESASTGAEFLTLKLSLIGMRPHLDQLVEYRVIDANNYVQSRGVIRGFPQSGDATVIAKRAIPRINGPYRLDFYADVNNSGGFDGLGSVITNDHAWRIEPLAPNMEKLQADDVVEVKFQHSTSFTNIDQYPSGTKNPSADTGLGAKIHLTGLDEAVGHVVEVRVADHLSHHVVGLHRTTSASSATIDAVIPGCVDLDTEYDVDIYVDANGDGKYDDPRNGGDRGWRLSATSAVKGLELNLDLKSPELGDGKFDVGEP